MPAVGGEEGGAQDGEDVLVGAVGEAEAVCAPEGAAQEARGGGGEAVGAGLRGRDGAPPVDPVVSEEEHVRFAPGQPGGDRVQGARSQQVVAVEEEQIPAARLGGPGVAGRTRAAVLGMGEHPGPRVARRELGGDLGAAVPRAVVDDEQLQLTGAPAEHGLQRRPEISLSTVDGHDNTEEHGSRA